MGHGIEPVGDGSRHLGLPAGQRLAHRIDAAGGLALRPQHFAQALLELIGAHLLRQGQFRATPAGPGERDGNDHEQQQGRRADPDQRRASTHRQVADGHQNIVHDGVVADSGSNANEVRTFLVNKS